MRVTEKGQVTIPKDIRDHLGILPGTAVDFIPQRDGAMLVVTKSEASQDPAREFQAWADRIEGMLDLDGASTDDFVIWVRSEADHVDAG